MNATPHAEHARLAADHGALARIFLPSSPFSASIHAEYAWSHAEHIMFGCQNLGDICYCPKTETTLTIYR